MENFTSTLTPIDFKVDLNTPPHQFGCLQLEKGCEDQINNNFEISENCLCASVNGDRQLEKACEKELAQITKDVEFSKIAMEVEEMCQITSNVDDSSIKQPATISSVSLTSFFMRILFSFRL